MTLVKSGGSLRRVAQNVFRTVQFSVGKPAMRKNNAVQVCGKHKDVRHLLQALSVGIAEGMQTLTISSPLATSVTRVISKHCTGLRSLSFEPASVSNFLDVKFCSIVAARGSGLDTLNVLDVHANDRVVAAIAEHCRGLRRLKLAFSKIRTSLESLWMSVRGKLQYLEITASGYHPKLSLDNLVTNYSEVQCVVLNIEGKLGFKATLEFCNSLRKLSFRPADSKNYLTLCKIIGIVGSALDSLSVSNLLVNARVVSLIAEHCANLRELSLPWKRARHSLLCLHNHSFRS